MSGDCGCGGAARCGCCEGVSARVPLPRDNRPGLGAIAYRIGDYGAFRASLDARLTSHALPGEGDGPPTRPLAGLRARRDDATPALLDAWAVVADVLTFYQERIANEAYLRTATQYRSLHELAALPGYAPRPGVSASGWLAFDLDPVATAPIEIPMGTRVQSLPGQDEMPQIFETTAPLRASDAWNRLVARRSRPQAPRDLLANGLWLAGITTGLKPGDPLLIAADGADPVAFRVTSVVEDADARRTQLRLDYWSAPTATQRAMWEPPQTAAVATTAAPPPGVTGAKATTGEGSDESPNQGSILDRHWAALIKPGARASVAARAPSGDAKAALAVAGSGGLALFGAVDARIAQAIGGALGGARVAAVPPLRVWAPRLKTGLFGRAFPAPMVTRRIGNNDGPMQTVTEANGDWSILRPERSEQTRVIALDGAHQGIVPGSWLLIDLSAVALETKSVSTARGVLVAKAAQVFPKLTRAAYGQTGETSEITLDRAWIAFKKPSDVPDGTAAVVKAPKDDSFQIIRRAAVYAASEELALAEAPLVDPLCDGTQGFALDRLMIGLEPGRLIALAGERADVAEVTGVEAAEVALIAAVAHHGADAQEADGAPGAERGYTSITLAAPLAYCYRRDTLRIYGNVARASHGQSRRELLGSGDATLANQGFLLKHAPVAQSPAVSPSGAASSVRVFVNDIAWTRVDTLIDQPAEARVYTESVRADGLTLVRFGDGRAGARLPTGQLNVAAHYREGLGRDGNLAPGRLAQLIDRPLGVRDVTNPIAASGGADPESGDQIRRNAPSAAAALGRLVALADYAAFARGFAGIAKATATLLPIGRRRTLCITLGAVDDAAIDLDSDLLRALRAALRRFGDPAQPIQVMARALVPVVIQARVAIAPDRRWESVSAAARAALVARLRYDARDFGQALAPSEVIAILQNTPGVTRVDLDLFGALPPISADRPPAPAVLQRAIDALAGVRPILRAAPARLGADGRAAPAELVALLGGGAESIILNPQA